MENKVIWEADKPGLWRRINEARLFMAVYMGIFQFEGRNYKIYEHGGKVGFMPMTTGAEDMIPAMYSANSFQNMGSSGAKPLLAPTPENIPATEAQIEEAQEETLKMATKKAKKAAE